MIGSSLVPMRLWGLTAASAVAITFGALEARLVGCPRWASSLSSVLLLLVVLIALSDVELVIVFVL